jgi:hypothetical protein
LATKYILALSDKEHGVNVANLGGNQTIIDTPLEISLLSYAAGVIDVRPVEADAILPANNPRLSGLKLGSAVLKELAEIRFLDPSNTAAIGRYEGMLKFISDKNGVSRAEIESYLKQGIAAVVDEEFNKVRFMMNNDTIRKGYSVTLTRTVNNQYILEYEGIYQGKDFYAKLPPASLEALLTTVQGDTANFDRTCVDALRDNAALIPAVIFDGWKKTTLDMVNPYELLTKALTDFYITPNNVTYQVVRGIVARAVLATITDGDEFSANMSGSIGSILISLNQALNDKVNSDLNTTNKVIAASDVPNDPRYDIFTLNKAAGDAIFVSKKRERRGD